jgi:hypothetical protein
LDFLQGGTLQHACGRLHRRQSRRRPTGTLYIGVTNNLRMRLEHHPWIFCPLLIARQPSIFTKQDPQAARSLHDDGGTAMEIDAVRMGFDPDITGV